MKYSDFYLSLQNYHLLSEIDGYLLDLIKDEMKKDSNPHEDEIMSLFAIYFSLVEDGNVAMSLNVAELSAKWKEKIVFARKILEDDPDFEADKYEIFLKDSLSLIKDNLAYLKEEDLPSIISKKGFFNIENHYLYLRKYCKARKDIKDAIERLFLTSLGTSYKMDLSYIEKGNDNFDLSNGQKEVVEKGVNANLIIDGGPGTGKTTSICFLLLNILVHEPNREIYLAAPSGKASQRMKEGIINSLSRVSPSFKKSHEDLIKRVNEVEESTIHRLLGRDGDSGKFLQNENKQFGTNSLFIIDEASMIDICLFASLLKSIPTGARIYIMGDKDQLPSVESGAVFADLVGSKELLSNRVRLTETKRFKDGSEIHALASAINLDLPLPIKEEDWKDYSSFEILEEISTYPVRYFLNEKEGVKEKDIIESFVKKWTKAFYLPLHDLCSSLEEDDYERLKTIDKAVERARILTAENKSIRGTTNINFTVKSLLKPQKDELTYNGNPVGTLLIINTNNRRLDLYNGDSGVLVRFKDDSCLYFMVKKKSKVFTVDKKYDDRIFKLGDFLFYPIRLI
nr:AAA family ATPase [Bacilli bacterium]